jgi:hypothetical protein
LQNEPAWLGLSVVIEANLQVVSITNETHHLRDSWLLESALAKPRNRFLYGGGLSRRDLEPLIGTRTRVAEVLNRKRSLSIGMIRRLHEHLGISAEALIRAPAKKKAA